MRRITMNDEISELIDLYQIIIDEEAFIRDTTLAYPSLLIVLDEATNREHLIALALTLLLKASECSD
jgi:hypothetical protein